MNITANDGFLKIFQLDLTKNFQNNYLENKDSKNMRYVQIQNNFQRKSMPQPAPKAL